MRFILGVILNGYFDTYQFFENGTFKFNTNQNDETRRIISIGWDNRTNTPLFVGMKLIPLVEANP